LCRDCGAECGEGEAIHRATAASIAARRLAAAISSTRSFLRRSSNDEQPEEERLIALREILGACSNPHVARAALASIGGEFALRFAADASRRDLPSGVLAARFVRAFAKNADDEEWRGVAAATRGADQPILSGLRYILARGLKPGTDAANGLPGEAPPASAICASREDFRRE
jgi:hypothetical protein